ncbi:MAG: PAS domain S-box protein, partial [Thermoplasmata archaeon]
MTPEQIIGHTLTELFPEVKGTPFYEVYREAMEKRTVQSVVSPFLFRDGREGFYEVKVYPVTGGILCIGRDITTQKRMEMA